MKQIVTITRHWSSPEIAIKISDELISLSISLEDYEKALAEELGNPALLLTNKQLKDKLILASRKVIEKVKEESAKVV